MRKAPSLEAVVGDAPKSWLSTLCQHPLELSAEHAAPSQVAGRSKGHGCHGCHEVILKQA